MSAWIESPNLKTFVSWITQPHIITSFLVAVAAVILIVLFNKIGKKYKSTNTLKGQKGTIIQVIFKVLKAVLVVVAVLVILQINGVNVTSMIAGLGIAGALIGLALQDWLKDAIMGIHIMSDRFFTIGDCVKYKETECIVTGFSLTSTKLKSIVDDTVITVCNRNIMEIQRIESTLLIDIPLGCTEDREKIDEIMKKICKESEKSNLVGKCIYKGLNSIESSSYTYRLKVSCKPKTRHDSRRFVLRTALDLLNKEGIYTPYDRIDVKNIEK